MKKLKVIQVGCTHEHASGIINSLSMLPELYEIVGWVDDRDIPAIRRSNEIFPLYNDYRKMSLQEALDYPELDAAMIEVPNNELVRIAKMFVEKGIPVHMDKPAGESMESYAELLDLCRKKHVPFQMGYMYRGNPALNYLKTLLKDNVIGEIFQADMDMNHGYGGEEYQEYIGKFKGGIMWNLGCHLIDFIVSVMGAPSAVTSFMKSAPGDPEHIRNNCTAVLEYPNAAVTLHACSRANEVGQRRWFFAGTRGYIEVSPPERFDGESVVLRMHLKESTTSFPQGETVFTFPKQSDRYIVQLQDFAKIVTGESESEYSYEHDALVHKITLAASNYLEWNGTDVLPPIRETPEKYWDFSKLTAVPVYQDAEFADSQYPGMHAVLFDGAEYQGKPAKVFAYIGLPDGPVPEGGFPGIVLLHGGGGTAYGWAVALWKSYGYAVITIDWYNQRPVSQNGETRVPLEGGKRQDHICNVANAILAHSLLQSLPQVNPGKIGFVGLSWGSWYGSTIASLDTRFRCVIDIYCGDLRQGAATKSRELVDGRFLHAAKVPMYWVAGTNDQNVTPKSLQAGFDECAKLWNKSMVIDLPHSHVGFRFAVCRRVADHFLKGGTELPKLGKNEFKDGVLSAPVLKQGNGIKKAILCYTCDRDHEDQTHLRKWESIPAVIENGIVAAKLPEKTFQCYLAVYDELPEDLYCCASSDLFEQK